MFTSLTEKIEKVFKQLRGQAVLTEQNITDALKEVVQKYHPREIDYVSPAV